MKGAVILRARWRGPAPAIGDYLKAPKGTRAYRVLDVLRIPGQPALGLYRLRLACARVPLAEMVPGVAVHPWRWDPRMQRIPRPGGQVR